MQYIPIITLILVVILLGLVIVLLTRKQEKPELPQQIDPTASITALGTLVTQNLREGREAQSNQLSAMDKSLGDKMSGLTDQLGRFETRLQGFTAETTQNLTNIRETVDKNLHTFTGETKQNLETIRSTMDKNLHTFTGETKQDLETIRETVDKNLHTFTGETKQDLENIRVTVDKNLRAMQEDNNKKLDDMRQIVDEKLQKTLSERMNESFKLVNERLEQVYKGLGEMQTLAQGVGDLKKVLTNVKTRGIVGEIQLGPSSTRPTWRPCRTAAMWSSMRSSCPLRTAALSGCRLTPSSRETPTGRSATRTRKARASRLTHASSS